MTAPIIILEESKLIWRYEEVARFRSLHEQYDHKPVMERIKLIASDMRESADDVLLLFIDQAQKGKIGNATN